MPAVVMSVAAALIYLADRTGFWLKEQKQFSPWVFTFLSLLSLAVGLGTMRQADKDLGFLNREQTDEWKGWMQSQFTSFQSTISSMFTNDWPIQLPSSSTTTLVPPRSLGSTTLFESWLRPISS